MSTLTHLIERLDQLLLRIEPLLPPLIEPIDFTQYSAFRWRVAKPGNFGYLEAIENPARISFNEIKCLEKQATLIRQNSEQFLHGYPANNLLLTGSRGTGKSSLVKACLHQYADQGLKMIEIDSDHLSYLPDILELIAHEPYRFILFCDDLSFEEGDDSYKSLKALLDGSLTSPSENILIYATSNRRHLLPEYMEENRSYTRRGGEIHAAEAVEEKISLSERFGLWISFYPFSQQEYLEIVRSWLNELADDIPYNEQVEQSALQFSLQRGSRSGRVAQQFIRHYIGSYRLEQQQ